MISSSSNIQVKNLIQLQKKAKARREQKAFVVEGIKMVMELPKEQWVKGYIASSFMSQCDHALIEKLDHCGYEVLEDKIFAQVSETVTPQGVLAIASQKDYDFNQWFQKEKPLVLFLESLQDPGNLGTIIRTAEGAGVDGVILNQTSVDIYNPKVIRSTMGSIYRVPFVYVSDFKETILKAKEHGVTLYAAHLSGEHFYYEENYTKSAGFMIGNEGNGLTKETADLATTYIKIPMSGQLESLNAAVASAILMYEAKRQRLS